MKERLTLVFLTLFFGVVSARAEAYESDPCHRHHNRHRQDEHCRNECERKTHALDVVFAPIADPVNSKLIVDVGTGFQVGTPPPYPAGSHFVFSGVVYPGHSFSTSGPFANAVSLIDPQRIIGSFTSTGAFSKDTTVFTPGSSNVNIGLASLAFDFFTYIDNFNSPCSVQSIFGNYTVKTINNDFPGTGLLARVQVAAISGGTGLNIDIKGTASSKTYVDSAGNLLIRFVFKEGVTLPEL